MVSLNTPQLIMFDLDGTLADTAPDLAVAVDQTLIHLGRRPVGERRVRDWLGRGFESLLQRALAFDASGCPDRAEADDLYRQSVEIFPDIYMRHLHDRSELYPGARDCLRQLRQRNVSMACVTNKHSRFSKKLIDSLGIAEYFSCIVSGDSLPRRKPDPQPLQWTMRKLGVPPSATLMVGDSDNDVKAARSAGPTVVGVSYGYCQVGMHALRPDAIVDSLPCLPDLFA